MPHPSPTYRLCSPPPFGSGGAIGIVQLRGDIDATLSNMRVRPVPVGRAVLREIPSVDTLVIARVDAESALIFPHAGPAVVASLIAALEAAGITRDESPTAAHRFLEAENDLEARMLDALSRALSPLAIDLLLDQPRRWRGLAPTDRDPARVLPEDASRPLRRLIEPPLVAALGPPNIGKSTLVNALAGRAVAIVADVPGTTRDHVGVSLNLAGLVIRYLDTPGIDPTSVPTHHEHARLDTLAQQLALQAMRGADLILLCADHQSEFLTPPHPGASTLRVGLRSDLGLPRQPADVLVSARTGSGLADLTLALRDRLVPPAILNDARAWPFW